MHNAIHSVICHLATSPPTGFTSSSAPDLLTYTFSWSAPDNLYDSVLLSYTVTCTPTLAPQDLMETKTLDNVTTSATLVLAHGLMYSCCVVATNRVGPSDENCLSDRITTPEAGIAVDSALAPWQSRVSYRIFLVWGGGQFLPPSV